MIFYYWKMCFLFEHPKDISELMVKTASFYLLPFLHNSSSKLAIYRLISVFSRENRRKSSKKRWTFATENDRTAQYIFFSIFFRHETFPNNILGILIERIGWILFR